MFIVPLRFYLFVRLFTCDSVTMAKHPVQAVPFVYYPLVPNYIVTRDYKRSITQLLAQQCNVNSNIHNSSYDLSTQLS